MAIYRFSIDSASNSNHHITYVFDPELLLCLDGSRRREEKERKANNVCAFTSSSDDTDGDKMELSKSKGRTWGWEIYLFKLTIINVDIASHPSTFSQIHLIDYFC